MHTRGRLAVLLLMFAPALSSAQQALADRPFWRTMAGWWRSENTYLDGALAYNIRSYNSLVHVELEGDRYRETEYKFYPPGKMAQQIGGATLAVGEGIETVSVTEGRRVDATGTVRLDDRERSEYRVLGDDTGVRVTANTATGVDTYRMFVFAPVPDKRYRSNFGIVSAASGPGAANALPGAKLGDLRGYSLFREDRIAASEFDAWRAHFRERNAVRAVAQPGADGKLVVRRLD